MIAKNNQKSLFAIAGIAAMLLLSPLQAEPKRESASEIMERYQRERDALDAKRAEDDRQRALDQKQVAKELQAYSFPLQQSRCADFVVDWNQIQTVQAYIQKSVAFSKELGDCLHAETKSNVETLAADLKKANIGETQWSWGGHGMPASIQSIGPFSKFSANFDRCNPQCFQTIQGLMDKAAGISKVKRDAFLLQWDNYTENNIKPAMKQQDPALYEQNNMDQKFADIRSALKHFAYQSNQPE